MQDIERGPISKLEKVLKAWKRLLKQKKNLRILAVIWFVFCCVLYKIPDIVVHAVQNVNFTTPTIKIQDFGISLPVVETEPLPPSEDSIRRHGHVQAHPRLYDGVVSTLYEFNSRLRNDVSLLEINAALTTVINEYSYSCLAAPHIGYMKNIMKIGAVIYVNSVISDNGADLVAYNEESAFYPDYNVKKQRYKIVTLKYFDEGGNQKSTELFDFQALCAQHCLDTINGKIFKQNDEL